MRIELIDITEIDHPRRRQIAGRHHLGGGQAGEIVHRTCECAGVLRPVANETISTCSGL